MNRLKSILTFSGAVFGLTLALAGALSLMASADQQQSGGFALEVSPSPLVDTIKPGVPTDVELKIRNQGTVTENLKIVPRAFSIDKQTGDVQLKETLPEIANWIKFSQQTFSVDPHKVVTEKIHIALPKDTGFSYSFALVISRASGDSTVQSGSAIHGSVAVFTLINVDRPGAVRKFDVVDFAPTAPIFEYLPADFKMTFKNTGNTIIQPAGNVFIQRGSNDGLPITTLPVNDSHGYLLPDSPRTLTTSWNDGFPVYKSTTGSDGKEKRNLTWDWSKLTDFRFGQYTAKLVAIYNDGHSDVPIEREVTFWVIPWRAILLLIVVIAAVLFLLRKLIHYRTQHAVSRALANKENKT